MHSTASFSFPFALTNWNGPGAVKSTSKNDKLPLLFTEFKQKDLALKNRIVVSPMCQYTSEDGFMSDWHLVHLGTLAKGGASLVIFEAAGVSPAGRITPYDAGIWKDEHIIMQKRIVDFVHTQKAAAGIQLAHAGRKASTQAPFLPGSGSGLKSENGGFDVVAPSSQAWSDTYIVPQELTVPQIQETVQQFADAAGRALKAGFDMIEIHGAHGYLITSFLSPLSNKRTDQYGGSFENRTRFLVEVVAAVQKVWPSSKPLWVRLSCTEWVEEGGWNIDDSVQVSKILKGMGVDLIDCSSGGNSHQQKIKAGPLFQTQFAERIKKDVDIPTGAVGLIRAPKDAEDILQKGQADVVLMAREFLREPNWALKAAYEMGVEVDVVPEYARAFPPHAELSRL